MCIYIYIHMCVYIYIYIHIVNWPLTPGEGLVVAAGPANVRYWARYSELKIGRKIETDLVKDPFGVKQCLWFHKSNQKLWHLPYLCFISDKSYGIFRSAAHIFMTAVWEGVKQQRSECLQSIPTIPPYQSPPSPPSPPSQRRYLLLHDRVLLACKFPCLGGGHLFVSSGVEKGGLPNWILCTQVN